MHRLHHAQRGVEPRRRSRGGRRPRLYRVARRRRAALGQRRVLRAHRQGKGDAAQPDPLGQRDPHRGLRGGAGADLLLDEAERAIFAIAEDRIREGFVPLRDLVQNSFATIEKLQQHKGLVTGVPTGFLDLDEMTSGLQPSDLVLVAARPSMGKTSFVLNIAQHVGTSTDMTVGFFSLEMSKEQLFLRLLTAEARIDSHRFRTGYLNEKDYGRLSHALGTLAEARVFIDDTASIGILEMRAKARRLKAEHGLHLLVIDYIQLMQGRGRFESRQQELASISRSLKGLAKELNVPIVALSQLSRAPETRSDHRPQLSDLRESGALEQDADVVMFIFREEQYARRRRAAEPGSRRDRRDHRRQTTQRPDRRGQTRVHQGTYEVRESRSRELSAREMGNGRWAMGDGIQVTVCLPLPGFDRAVLTTATSIATSSDASSASGRTGVFSDSSVADINSNQNRASRASLSAMQVFAMKSRFDWPSRAS